MTTPRFIPTSFTLVAAGVAVFFAGSASAGQACNTPDAPTCPTGFQCEVVGGAGCAEPACAPGETCPTPPPCVTTTFSECVPGPCTTDADCGTGMVCYEQTETACPATGAPSCAPGQACPPPPPPEPCTTTTTKSCVPRYVVPCQLDVNCGDGFTCVPDQECSCSGGGGVGFAMDGGAAQGSGSSGSAGGASIPSPKPLPSGAGGGTSTPPTPNPIPDPACTCTTLATSHCVAKQVVCKTAGDCPSQWTCEAMATSGGTTCVGAAPSGDGGIAPTPPVCDPLPQPPSVDYCMPPYANLVRGTSAGATLGETTGSGATTGTGTGAPATPPAVGAGGSSGQDNQAGTGGTGTAGTANAAAPSTAKDSGGCQVGLGRSSSSGTALLGLLGFLGLARRRRARAA